MMAINVNVKNSLVVLQEFNNGKNTVVNIAES